VRTVKSYNTAYVLGTTLQKRSRKGENNVKEAVGTKLGETRGDSMAPYKVLLFNFSVCYLYFNFACVAANIFLPRGLPRI